MNPPTHTLPAQAAEPSQLRPTFLRELGPFYVVDHIQLKINPRALTSITSLCGPDPHLLFLATKRRIRWFARTLSTHQHVNTVIPCHITLQWENCMNSAGTGNLSLLIDALGPAIAWLLDHFASYLNVLTFLLCITSLTPPPRAHHPVTYRPIRSLVVRSWCPLAMMPPPLKRRWQCTLLLWTRKIR
jgi:hypothetical protein